MRILFVWPHRDQPGYKSLSIALLSALLKKAGHEVDLFDTTFIDLNFQNNSEVRSKLRIFKEIQIPEGLDLNKHKVNLEEEFLKKLNSFKPDIVGVSALSDEIYIGFELSEIAKAWNRNVTVVWGNKAASMAPEKILGCRAVDYLCIGEGVEFITDFVDALENKKDLSGIKNLAYRDSAGKTVINKLRPYYQDLDSLPFLDWDIFDTRQFYKPYDGQMYRGGDHMIFWGCNNSCTYCINDSYRKLYGKNAGPFLRRYSVDRIIDELSFLVNKWKIAFFKFHDEDFCLKPIDYFKELVTKYRAKIGVPFAIMANARNVTAEKVALLKEMNCVSVTIGIETGNEQLRSKILRRRETKDEIIRSSKLLNEAGIRTSAFNMLGIPFENRSTFMETVALNRAADVRYPNAGFFFPLEGTELRETAVSNGFFNEESKLVFQNDRPVLQFSEITSDELVALRERFVLYIKMPLEFYPYIERSEKADEIGRQLTGALYRMYDERVFSNDGFWVDNSYNQKYLAELDAIIGGKLK